MTDSREALAHDAEQQRQRIRNQPAGPELDVLVVEQVFGWQPAHDALWRLPDGALVSRLHLPPSSTEASAAMAVLEQFDWYDVKGARRGNGRVITVTVGAFDQEGAFWVETTFPLAAAKAALLATLEARPR